MGGHRPSAPGEAVPAGRLLHLRLVGVVSTTVLVGGGSAGASSVRAPRTPAGDQLSWLLSITALPISTPSIAAHFDAAFLSQVTPAQLNAALATVATGRPRLLGLSELAPTSLDAVVAFGASRFSVSLSVDPSGLIETLLFKPDDAVPTSWGGVDNEMRTLAPDVGFLAARVDPDGKCTAVHSIAPDTARPLGSMFKLFIIGALADAVRTHKVSWNEKLTITAGVKTGGSGTLQDVPDGTQMTVEQVAITTISVSDNTGADLLLQLVGRAAVEAQVRKWAARPSLDTPFLTAKELFALHYDDFPKLAQHYLSLKPAQRAAYLASTVDALPASAEVPSSSPRDIGTIEWFASPDDLCNAFSGLARLQSQPGLSPLNTVFSTNNGGIGLNATTWPRVWFKGGSEPGVLTLGYLARDRSGATYVVVALTENPAVPLSQASTLQLLEVVHGAFGLLHR